jgi:hypothetical protein
MLDPASMEADKLPQVQMQLLVTQRKYVALVEYHPEMAIVIRKVYPHPDYISTLHAALETFCDTLDTMRMRLEREFGPFPELKPPTPARPLADDDPGALGVSMDDFDRLVEARERGTLS